MMTRFTIPVLALLPGALAAQAWEPVTTARDPGQIRDMVAAYDLLRNNTVLFGGRRSTHALSSDTWLFDGVSWTLASPPTSPTGRTGSAIANDFVRGRTVMFGGAGNLQDTWEWDGTTWHAVTTATTPSPRTGHSMAFDALRGVVVMFGGTRNPDFYTPALRETWEYDGVDWKLVPTANSPANPVHGAMCFDLNRQRIVYYGGENDGSSDKKTWEYDGTDWIDVSARVGDGPTSRAQVGVAGASMVFDLRRRTCVLHGGRLPGIGGYVSETWEYDGASWTQVSAGELPMRAGFAMVYDVMIGATVAYGGWTGAGTGPYFTETWTYDEPVAGSYTTIGAGCAGSHGLVATLQLAPGVEPRLGEMLTVEIGELPPSATSAVMILGLSRLPGPFDLTGIGMPACALHVLPDFAFTVPASGGAATWQLAMPTTFDWLSYPIFNQVMTVDPGVNQAGAAMSDAAELRLGS